MTFLRLAIHPNALQMAICQASAVMIAWAEKIRDVCREVLSLYLRLEEDALLCRNRLFCIAGIAVPDDTTGLQFQHFIYGRIDGFP